MITITSTTYYRFKVDEKSYSILFDKDHGTAGFPYMVAILDSRNCLIKKDWLREGLKPSTKNAQYFAEKHEQFLKERNKQS